MIEAVATGAAQLSWHCRPRLKPLQCAIAVGLCLGLAPIASAAAVFTVTTLADSNDGVCDTDCSVREAIGAANANANPSVFDVVDASLVAGTITLAHGEIAVNERLTVQGPRADALILDAHGASRVLSVDEVVLRLEDLTLSGGFAASSGGAIFVFQGGLALERVKIEASTARYGGGFSLANGYATLLDSTIDGNSAGVLGGGFLSSYSDVSLTGTGVSGNTAGYLGGGFMVFNDDNEAHRLVVANSRIHDNTAQKAGGGFAARSMLVNISDSTIENNKAYVDGSLYTHGGGIYAIGENGTLLVTRSTVSNNRAYYGGGIWASTDAMLDNATVTGNTGYKYGGGIQFTGNTVTLTHCTIAGNSATAKGGGMLLQSTTIAIDNSILADNDALAGPDLYASGGLTVRYSLVEDRSGNGIPTGNGNIFNVDPGLGSLQDNGGPTYTRAIAPSSAAYNTGDPNFADVPSNDQRGAPRVSFGRTDMGAYEVLSGLPLNPVDSLDDAGEGFCSPADCTLREALEAANAATGNDTVLFDSTLSGTIDLDGSELRISGPTTIAGPGADLLTLNAGGLSRVFFADTGATFTTISGLTLTAGKADASGGALYAKYDLVLDGVTVEASEAGLKGGGFFANGAVTVRNSTIANNTAELDGGGFFAYDAVVIENSTFAGNVAGDDGGGFYAYDQADLEQVTLSGNFVVGSGGGFFAVGDTRLATTIVANNQAGNFAEFDLGVGAVLDADFSLVKGASSPVPSGSNGNLVGVDPLLGTLNSNGGPTPTLLPQITSPVLDHVPLAACVLDTDQRGVARPLGPACDMGAVERLGDSIFRDGFDPLLPR